VVALVRCPQLHLSMIVFLPYLADIGLEEVAVEVAGQRKNGLKRTLDARDVEGVEDKHDERVVVELRHILGDTLDLKDA
ncbi:hypothetical protein HDU99_008852, partial [Rhizoclosmatium hyalinum]